jgi:hypothetical protein
LGVVQGKIGAPLAQPVHDEVGGDHPEPVTQAAASPVLLQLAKAPTNQAMEQLGPELTELIGGRLDAVEAEAVADGEVHRRFMGSNQFRPGLAIALDTAFDQPEVPLMSSR